MKLSMEAISEFQLIYSKQFGIILTDHDANKKGLELLEFFQTIYRKVPNQDSEVLQLINTEYRAS